MDRLHEGLRHDSTLLAVRMPGNIWCRGKYHQIPQENAQLEDNSYKLWNQVSRGIFQGDSLSPLLFIVAMIPMARVLERMEVGYQFKKGGSRINHLMFMDDLKLFGRGNEEIDALVQIVRIVSGDIRMEFGEMCTCQRPERKSNKD